MHLKEIHLKFPVNACKKNFFSFALSVFFLVIISDKVAKWCLRRQDLRICVMEITQNSISHPTSLLINYVIKSVFLVCCADSSMLLFENCRERVFQQRLWICVLQIIPNNTSHPKSLMVINYVIIWIIFEDFSSWSKHAFV